MKTRSRRKPANFDVQLLPNAKVAISETTELRSRDAYLVARLPLAQRLRGELGLFDQRARSGQTSETRVNGRLLGAPTDDPRTFAETNWRGGLQWQFGPQSSLTAVGQKWRRPASAGSVAPIDTLGIAVNDRLTTNGGLYRRNRLQVDHEASAATFVQAFIDRETVQNISSPLTVVVPDLQLTQLESLRNRRDAFSVAPELEQAPQFLEGRASSYGAGFNQRLSRDHTVAVRYRRATPSRPACAMACGFRNLSRDYLRLASHWSLPQRWLAGATATCAANASAMKPIPRRNASKPAGTSDSALTGKARANDGSCKRCSTICDPIATARTSAQRS